MGTAGGQRIVQLLVDDHYGALYRYAYRLSGKAADAEDLTQETFGKVIPRLAQLREPERAKAWLFRILRNAYLHKVRDERRGKFVPLEDVAAEDSPDATPDVDPATVQAALNDALDHPLI